jgi:hypothetical protein
MANAHALLATAAALGLIARLDVAEASAWRDVAGIRLTDPGA